MKLYDRGRISCIGLVGNALRGVPVWRHALARFMERHGGRSLQTRRIAHGHISLRLAVLALLLIAAPAQAEDVIRYFDRAGKKEIKIGGVILSESPGQVVLRSAAGTSREIPVRDIVEIEYEVSNLIKLDYIRAMNREKTASTDPKPENRARALAEAETTYREILPKAPSEKVRRHLEFKLAKLAVLKAQDDPKEAGAAVEQLMKFTKEHGDGWQLYGCTEMLAGLLIQKKDYDAAQKAYEDLAATPSVSPEMIQHCNVKITQVMIRARKFAEAEKRLQDLMKKLAPKSPQAMRAQVLLAECQAAKNQVPQAIKVLNEVIAKTSDAEIKAAAYNNLGDCHRSAGSPKEAIWCYLWVDVVYHHNKEEHAKALYYLYLLFKDQNDEPRANQFRERLQKDKQFAGLEYQKLLGGEK